MDGEDITVSLVSEDDGGSSAGVTDTTGVNGYILRAEAGSIHRLESGWITLMDFEVTRQSESTVAANSFTSFTVRYQPCPLSATLLANRPNSVTPQTAFRLPTIYN